MGKILFLTSSPFTSRGGAFNEANGFVEKLKSAAENYWQTLTELISELVLAILRR
jgi:hypothetical protein